MSTRNMTRSGYIICLLFYFATTLDAQINGIRIMVEARDKPDQHAQRFAPNQVQAMIFNHQTDKEGAAKLLKKRLISRADVMTATYGLTPDQTEKLVLAGRGDIHYFMTEITELQQQFEENQLNNLWQEVQPLRNKYHSGLYNRGSLFQKAMYGAVSPSQRRIIQQREIETRRFRLETQVRQLVCRLDRIVILEAPQRKQLIELLIEHTPSPETDGPDIHRMMPSYLLYFASKIPEEDVVATIGTEAATVFRHTAKRYARQEQMLKQQGMLK